MPSQLQCIACQHRLSLQQSTYACPKCQSLLEVEHGLELGSKSPQAWKELFDARLKDRRFLGGSGVWRFVDWVLPQIPHPHVVTLGEGASALCSVPRLNEHLGLQLFIKQCGHSHTGSFKDLGMTVLVSWVNHLRQTGKAIEALVCASTGDTSAALAAYGAAAGIPVVVILPKGKISQAQLIQPLSNGARVVEVDTDFDGCMEHVQALAQDERFYLANSKNSLRIEGQKTVAYEIAQDLNWELPTWVVIPGGNLGNVSALVRGFSELKQAGLVKHIPKILVAQADAASPLHQAYRNDFLELVPQVAQETYASAIRIGNPVSYPKAVEALRQSDGVVEAVSEAEIAEVARRLDTFGPYLCPHTAVALAAIEKQKEQGTIQTGDEVVVVSTAHGLKFTEFKLRAQNEHLGTTPKRGPVEVPHELDAVKKAALSHDL